MKTSSACYSYYTFTNMVEKRLQNSRYRVQMLNPTRPEDEKYFSYCYQKSLVHYKKILIETDCMMSRIIS